MTEGGALLLESGSEADTEALGAALARVLRPGTVVLLDGDLGAGKTAFCRGVVHGLGVTDPYITSPTFTLMNPYDEGRLPVYHFDLYRLAEPEELLAIGAEEQLSGAGVSLVEWPQRGGELLPADHLLVTLHHLPEHPERRRLRITASGPSSQGVLDDYRRSTAP